MPAGDPKPQSRRVPPRRSTVVCVECSRESDPRWRGWGAYLVEDPDGDEPVELAFRCPACILGSLRP